LLYFSADDGTHGPELWVTDGTDQNTQLVKDINTSTSGITGSSPTGLFVFNGSLYFDADSGTTGPELYKSDGTGAGTAKLKDVNPTISGSGFKLPTIFNNAIYFIATNGTNGQELFRTDGTAAGTVMVRDINPGSADAFNANSVSMRVSNGSLYFYANDNVHGNEVWKLSPQAATGNGFNVNTPAVTVTFNDPAIVNNTAATYTIQNLPDGGTFSPLSVTYDAASRTASFALPANLADGRYRLTIPATAATDAYGNWMASTYTADFFILTGDANHNGVVDTADFTALAQNFNSPSATYAQGDFNRDGTVNALDFNVLATRFGAMLPAPALLASQPAVGVRPDILANLFGSAPVQIDDSVLA
jgi:ELWxxDGT repeat protein